MSTETPERKKPWEKDPISAAEWRSNQATINAVRDEDSDGLRQMIKGKLKSLIGSHLDPLQHSTRMATYLIKVGALIKPEWQERSTLTLEHFGTEELAEAYTKVKVGVTPPVKDDDADPF